MTFMPSGWDRLLASSLLAFASACAAAGSDGVERQLPAWAMAQGQDAYGAWADFELAGERVRLRRIRKGSFVMGSPESEGGRGPDELQHEVIFTRDLWLAESECTQQLWHTVMGSNPSRFVSEQRPVENVTWPDVQLFLERLNERVPQLQARLPSEAEWEYSSRAGTDWETYAGPLEILSAYNAPILDGVAWYGGNSGVDFELDNGLPALWPDAQHPSDVGGSHDVKGKQPNAWGVYDSLGNLWEWCQDWFGPYETGPATDPQGAVAGEGRVIRGGSWADAAVDLRVANRNQGTPVDKVIILGFRIARTADD